MSAAAPPPRKRQSADDLATPSMRVTAISRLKVVTAVMDALSVQMAQAAQALLTIIKMRNPSLQDSADTLKALCLLQLASDDVVATVKSISWKVEDDLIDLRMNVVGLALLSGAVAWPDINNREHFLLELTISLKLLHDGATEPELQQRFGLQTTLSSWRGITYILAQNMLLMLSVEPTLASVNQFLQFTKPVFLEHERELDGAKHRFLGLSSSRESRQKEISDSVEYLLDKLALNIEMLQNVIKAAGVPPELRLLLTNVLGESQEMRSELAYASGRDLFVAPPEADAGSAPAGPAPT